MRHRPTITLLIATTLVATVLIGAPVSAHEAALEAEIPETRSDTLPSFAESSGCGVLDGVRGPLAPEAGYIPPETLILGPWGDFYGRSKGAAYDQRIPVQLPGQSKTLWVHERVLPAFQQVVANLQAEAAAGNHYTITSNTWSLNNSTIPPRRHFSFHAVGAAIDVNSTTNPYRADNVLITNMPEWFVDAWRDAGWCWGGDWQTIKDPMHFSWMGPIHTPGYEMPAPQDPIVGTADFTAEVDLGVMLPPDGGTLPELVADVDRDGAVDVVRIEPLAGSDQYLLRTAVARHAFETCTVTPTTATPYDPGAPVYLKDLTDDGRPDLVYADAGGATLSFEVFPWAQYAALRPEVHSTGVIPSLGDHYLFGDHDRDGSTDLYVIRAGDPAELEIWQGPAFANRIVHQPLGVTDAGRRFDLGDLAVDGHFDGIPDVYALADDGTLVIHLANDDFAPTDPIATGAAGDERMFVEDLDGDGHDDLLLTDTDGATRMLRGGQSTHDPGIWYELPEDEWVPGAGCSTPPPMCDDLVATLIGSNASDGRTIYANDGDNVIIGLAASEFIHAYDGDDVICAGPGHDTVYGGPGNDIIHGESGDDWLEGGEGRDRLFGGNGLDTLFGGPGRDRLLGGPLADRLRGGPANDRLRGGGGVDDADGDGGAGDVCFAETVIRCELPAP